MEPNIIDMNTCQKFWQNYEVLGVIGNGAFGICYKVRDKKTKTLYAWKCMNYDEFSEIQQESLISEIQVLRQLNHPNIVQYYHHMINKEAKSIFIVMEYCEGGDLAKLIKKARHEHKRFEELYIWRVLYQILGALKVCHNKIQGGTILHRDIKPANIFLDAEGNVKLGDFGLARVLHGHELFTQTFVGTPYYMSPEIVKGSKYDRKSDVWALGCLTYEMCTLRPPFKGQEFQQLFTNISTGKFPSISKIFSTDLEDIISFMLEIDSEMRPTVDILGRHPIVIRNINNLDNCFPCLLDIETTEQDFNDTEYSLNCSPLQDLSSTMISRQLRISGVNTPDLKAELFYSARRRLFSSLVSKNLQQSNTPIYESFHLKSEKCPEVTPKLSSLNDQSPDKLTQEIFERTLQKRLHSIRAQELLLCLKEENLKTQEEQLNKRERRVTALEKQLLQQQQQQQQQKKIKHLRYHCKTKMKSDHFNNEYFMSQTISIPPPRPPKKAFMENDDTYCSIEPNDITLLHEPTIAKLNIMTLPKTLKTFSSIRRVTFQSPNNKFITYDIENKANATINDTQSANNFMEGNASNKESKDTTHSRGGTGQRRKSLLSILGLSRSRKENTNIKSTKNNQDGLKKKEYSEDSNNIVEKLTIKSEPLLSKDKIILSKCKTSELSIIWTEEHKRAAFQLLAAMNSNELTIPLEEKQTSKSIMRHKIYHPSRERINLPKKRLKHFHMDPKISGYSLNQHQFSRFLQHKCSGKIIL